MLGWRENAAAASTTLGMMCSELPSDRSTQVRGLRSANLGRLHTIIFMSTSLQHLVAVVRLCAVGKLLLILLIWIIYEFFLPDPILRLRSCHETTWLPSCIRFTTVDSRFAQVRIRLSLHWRGATFVRSTHDFSQGLLLTIVRFHQLRNY